MPRFRFRTFTGLTFRPVLFLLALAMATPLAARDRPMLPDTSAPSAPAARVLRIEFSGNEVTRERILRQEMVITEGDPADPAHIERSRQAIMDLGLFVSVESRVEPEGDGVVLHIDVKEKYFILPIPKLNRDEDNNISLGAELGFENLAGLNQKLKLRFEGEKASGLSGGNTSTSLISYIYPRVWGGPWLFNVDVNQTRSPVEDLDTSMTMLVSLYEKEAWMASVQFSRWLNDEGISRGWQVGSGLVWRQNSYDFVSGIPNTRHVDAQSVGVSLLVQNIDVRDFLFSRRGKEYGYSGEIGSTTLGSDTHYTRHELFYRKYLLLDGRPHENVDIQARVGLSSGDLFPDDLYAYQIGGSKTLRGFSTGSFTGNSFVVLNVQYLRPFFDYYPFRGVLFVDAGNAYPSNTEMHVGDLKWNIGTGFRLRLKYFVKVDLRFDAAYAPEIGEWKYFFGTKEMF